jgi:hypothetical protein
VVGLLDRQLKQVTLAILLALQWRFCFRASQLFLELITLFVSVLSYLNLRHEYCERFKLVSPTYSGF